MASWTRLGNPDDKGINITAAAGVGGWLEAFLVGTANDIWHTEQSSPGGAWGAWTSQFEPDAKGISIAAARSQDGRMEVFLVGTAKDVWHIWETSPAGPWSEWTRLYAPADQGISIAAATNHDGRMEVFLVGTANDVWHTWQTVPGGGWTGSWQRLYAPDDQGINIAAGRNHDGRLEVFLVGTANDVWHTWQTAPGGGWAGSWNRLYAPADKGISIAAATNADGRLEVFLVGTANDTWHTWQTIPGGAWTGAWNRLSAPDAKGISIAAATNADGRLEVFLVGTANDTWHTWQIAPGAWPPPAWEVITADAQVLAIHAALLRTGDILYFGGDEHNQAQHDANEIDNTRLFHVATNTITQLPSPTTDVFCSGHAFLEDGRLLVGGGTEEWGGPHAAHEHLLNFGGHRACWAYNPDTRVWDRVADMNFQPGGATGGGRWYPTLITQADGDVLAVFGHPSRTDTRHRNNTPERYSTATNTWELRPALAENIDPLAGGPLLNYPRLHVLPDRRVFFSTPVTGNRFYHPGSGAFEGPAIPAPSDPIYQDWYVTSVLLPLLPGENYEARVLVCGGAQPRRINLDDTNPAWQNAGTRTGPAAGRVRLNLCAVILPTGDVFLSGGVSVMKPENPVFEGEVYSPGIDWTNQTYTGNESWVSTEPATVPRNYHSVALLMPNGRVWTAGSSENADPGNPAQVGEMRIEIYKPPYDADANRPVIAQSPATLRHGQTFELRSPQAGSIRRVALIRAGSVTHAFDADQRYVGLQFGNAGGDLLTVTAPPTGGVAPPGYYMLWIIDDVGRPCQRAAFVHVPPEGFAVANFGLDAGGWRVDRHPRFLADTTGDGRADIVGFGSAGVYVSRAQPDGSFSGPQLVVGNFGYDAGGWRVDHPRFLADTTGDGRADIVGFGNAGVVISRAQPDGSFSAPQLVVGNFGYDAGGWRVDRHPRFLADTTGDGRADIVGFGNAGVYVSHAQPDGTYSAPQWVVASFGYDRGWRVEHQPRLVADTTGDGRADIVGFGNAGVQIARAQPNGTFTA